MTWRIAFTRNEMNPPWSQSIIQTTDAVAPTVYTDPALPTPQPDPFCATTAGSCLSAGHSTPRKPTNRTIDDRNSWAQLAAEDVDRDEVEAREQTGRRDQSA